MLRRDYDYFAAGGGVSLDVSILWVSVVVLVPSGVVTVVSFLTSAFLSQPTVNGTTRLKARAYASRSCCKSLGHNMFWFRAKRDWSLGSDDVLAITFRNRSWTTQLMDL